jgi:hypothetical protein
VSLDTPTRRTTELQVTSGTGGRCGHTRGSCFGLSRGPRRVSLDLQPGYEEARLTVADDHGDVVDLLLRQVQSVEVDRVKGREVLKIGFADGLNTASVFVQLKPEISIGWEPFAFP